jgi:hypothetical protein
MVKNSIFIFIFFLIQSYYCYSQPSDRLTQKDIKLFNENKSTIDSIIQRFLKAEEENDLSFLKENFAREFSDSNKYLKFVKNNNMKYKVYDFDNDGEYYKVINKNIHSDFIEILSYETYKKYDTYPQFVLPECEAIATIKI